MADPVEVKRMTGGLSVLLLLCWGPALKGVLNGFSFRLKGRCSDVFNLSLDRSVRMMYFKDQLAAEGRV
jgi:hypothetical protein